ncbi:Tex family protein [Muriventricola aceti]|uniref:Tex family protein n=1 Tax=Muriventricola aceti TaxID=2981773 RepID=UPI0008234C61|nr:Tex family protein [Muriventricola aceti]MCU6701665.1 RNA-binding transcriptional accessory protein [Muriventricola aceti]SCI71577.1 30S ribosomal protein S1 [uncultured Flavonifractor sp.]
MDAIIQALARELGRSEAHIKNVVNLIDEGATIPFIARYRKELHGSMDDQLLRQLADRLQYLRNLEARKSEVKASIENQGKLTEDLAAAVDRAITLAEVEDLYRPYKQKRRTRATAARERGLEPLALLLFGKGPAVTPEEAAADFVDLEKGVETLEDALQGASDIIAELISDDAEIRKELRDLYLRRGVLVSRAADKEPEDSVYRLYYDFKCPVGRLQGYQVLAVNRGEREGILKVSVELDPETAHVAVRRLTVPGAAAMEFVRNAADDAYDRLIQPSMEREIRSTLSDQANEGAIHMFALNLKPLLMQPPVKGKVTMGLDPGYRMGCKVAVVDGTGKVLDTAVVYPTHGERQKQECIAKLAALIKRYGVEHIAIGNGTASRETEQMTVELIKKIGGGVSYMIVSEAGASVYSASKLAAEEFPQFDVNLRSAVSIARRLQDPLAELVKIDPKAIGVGQYQHDMPQARLGETLDGVVEDCVNAVGVDANTASPSLLQRVSGLTAATAKNLVAYREENGPFTARKQLLKVPKLGPKAFEQCAGFLRVPESGSVLDNTGVHPESYGAAEKLLAECGYTLDDVKAGELSELKARAEAIGLAQLAERCGAGLPTLSDIIKELMKPGRDPRDELPPPILRTDVMEAKDLKPGMELQGTVRNVIDFGVFVDIGVHQDGLVHISKLPRRVKHPSELLTVGDIVTVWVLEVDEKKKRISLTMKKPG